MTSPVRTHLTLLPEPESVASIAGLRRRFDSAAAWHEIGGRSWALDLRLDRVALTRTSVDAGLVAERWFHVGG